MAVFFKRYREAVVTILKGIWVGGTMTVPGVSGGSMAMIMGIYDKLITSVSSFFRKPRESILFLMEFLAGAAVGMLLFAKLISYLFTTSADIPVRFFFLGAVAGGVPLIYRKASIRELNLKAILYPISGILLVELLAMIPEGFFAPEEGAGLLGIVLQFVGGIIIAIGLVLPGISVSQMLYMLGIYEEIMKNISQLNVLPLIPLGIGVMGGIFGTTRLLENLLNKYPQPTYLIILGFMFGSLPQLLPVIPTGQNLFLGIVSAIAGFLLLYGMSENKVL